MHYNLKKDIVESDASNLSLRAKRNKETNDQVKAIANALRNLLPTEKKVQPN